MMENNDERTDMKYKAGDELYLGNDRVEVTDTFDRKWVPGSELDVHFPEYQISLRGGYQYERVPLWVHEGELHELPLWQRLERIEKALGL